MKTKTLTLIIFIAVNMLLLNAQSIDINGRILNQDSNPVSGVKVTLKNKALSDYTDSQGYFSFESTTTAIETIDDKTMQVYYDGKAVYFTNENQNVRIAIYNIVGQLKGQINCPSAIAGKYKFYPSAYLPGADGKMYIVSIYAGDNNLHSLKILNASPNKYEKGTFLISEQNQNSDYHVENIGQKSTMDSEEVNEVDKLIFEHNSYNTKEVSLSSYIENLGDITIYKINVPGISAPSSSNGTFTVTITYDWNSGLMSSSDRYELEESTTSSSSGFVKVNNSAFGSRPASYDVSLTRSSGTYYYRARVYELNGFSGYSNVISVAVTAASIPNAPSNITVEARDPKSIRIKWTDNSNNETGFEIQRQNAANTNVWDVVATTNANATSYNHTGLSETWPGYRVRAVNSGGSSSWTNISFAPRILRIVNDLYSSKTGFGDWGLFNQIVRVRIANSQAEVENSKTYERLNPREIVYDATSGKNISPNYNQTSSYKDFEIDSYNGINTKYYVFIQCGWWDFCILGSSSWWEIRDTKVFCTDGVSVCYKAATFWANHYNGYLVVTASQFLPYGHWNNTKSTNTQSVSQKE